MEQAEEISGVPALAALPSISSRELAGRAKRGRTELGNYDPRTMRLLPAALQPPLMRYAIEEPGTFFAEAIRAVRLAIQRARKIDTVKVVLVTSGLESEGKTTFAGNLALSFATLGIKTLLIDGDLRNPGLTRAVSPNADAGLLQVATGEVSLERAILLDRSTGLSILPSPAIKDVDAITELMFSEQIVEILDRLKSHYELIIIDSPPLIPLVDGRALAELADRILLAVAWNQTPREVVAHTMELLAPVHDRILGTVLTQVDLSKIRFYDYYRSSAYLKPYGVAAASASCALTLAGPRRSGCIATAPVAAAGSRARVPQRRQIVNTAQLINLMIVSVLLGAIVAIFTLSGGVLTNLEDPLSDTRRQFSREIAPRHLCDIHRDAFAADARR